MPERKTESTDGCWTQTRTLCRSSTLVSLRISHTCLSPQVLTILSTSGYRRRWGAYRAYYLLVKLSVLVIVAIFSKDNCLFRNVLPRATMEVIRQGVLLFFLFIWLAVQVFLKPFTDSNSNSSEVVSRRSVSHTSLIVAQVSAETMPPFAARTSP